MILAGTFFLFGDESYRENIYENIHMIPFIVGAGLLLLFAISDKNRTKIYSDMGFRYIIFLVASNNSRLV